MNEATDLQNEPAERSGEGAQFVGEQIVENLVKRQPSMHFFVLMNKPECHPESEDQNPVGTHPLSLRETPISSVFWMGSIRRPLTRL